MSPESGFVLGGPCLGIAETVLTKAAVSLGYVDEGRSVCFVKSKTFSGLFGVCRRGKVNLFM